LRDDGNYDGINFLKIVGRDYGIDDEWTTKTFTEVMTEMMTEWMSKTLMTQFLTERYDGNDDGMGDETVVERD